MVFKNCMGDFAFLVIPLYVKARFFADVCIRRISVFYVLHGGDGFGLVRIKRRKNILAVMDREEGCVLRHTAQRIGIPHRAGGYAVLREYIRAAGAVADTGLRIVDGEYNLFARCRVNQMCHFLKLGGRMR